MATKPKTVKVLIEGRQTLLYKQTIEMPIDEWLTLRDMTGKRFAETEKKRAKA